MPSVLSTKAGHRLVSLATFVLVVAVLHWGREVILPLALAGLIVFLLTPLVVRFHRFGMPKALAIISAVLIAFSVLATVGGFVVWQLADLVAELPKYERNIHEKVVTLREVRGPRAWQRTMEMVQEYSSELQGVDAGRSRSTASSDGPQPVPVEVHTRKPSSFNVLRSLASPLIGVLATAGIVVVFVVAMLFQREDLRDRFIQVVSAGRINLTTQALDDAARRVSRYLFLQLLVNATYGIPIGIGLYFIGIPNAMLWGLLATLLRFIPFLGPWIAALFPVVLAVAVDAGFSKLIATLLLFLVMELLSNNVIEIMVYRSGTGISNLALLVAAVFWTWLWGPVGLFLSTPLTACILVLGKHVPSLRLLSTLLGSEPVLKPAAQFYQRMLSMDSDEMDDRAADYIAQHSLLEFFRDVLAPALLLAEEDRHRGALAEVRQRFILRSVRELIADLEHRRIGNGDAAADSVKWPVSARILIVPAGDDADELVALMFAVLLRHRGFEAEVTAVSHSRDELSRQLEEFRPELVLVSALPPHAASQAARTCRFLASLLDSTPIVAGVWLKSAAHELLRERMEGHELAAIVSRLDEALEEIRRQVERQRTASPFTAPAHERSSDVAPLSLLEIEPAAWVDVVTRDLAGVFEVPLSLVAIIDLKASFWPEEVTADIAKVPEGDIYSPLSPRFQLEPGEDLLVVEDLASSAAFNTRNFTSERGIKFYVGVVLRTSRGESVGAICIVDTKKRSITEVERLTLVSRARELADAADRLKARDHVTDPESS
ncbi:AI-2E family transporter [Synoicihabitans lomoniglobus]|uniref:AI-2E family transporter n=1 Tax=Synoicihabitans lomoniglobus TaxID=2909285 RepID=A0AAE9ZWX0_9BACT|nr:AI-2E family transporter [Opitutaceae bacterium LMO-M01]WED64589.1 AI-2E family transporter [Opitutaceae bacterium LMO-M01]